eukprot:GHVN01046783.1.p1 GENE.GHVN01046783.1~~GHVN01046783.1.p1  ORF type:complete len:113 (-),score=8.45 GHVN01046783.1:338-676(-)
MKSWGVASWAVDAIVFKWVWVGFAADDEKIKRRIDAHLASCGLTDDEAHKCSKVLTQHFSGIEMERFVISTINSSIALWVRAPDSYSTKLALDEYLTEVSTDCDSIRESPKI